MLLRLPIICMKPLHIGEKNASASVFSPKDSAFHRETFFLFVKQLLPQGNVRHLGENAKACNIIEYNSFISYFVNVSLWGSVNLRLLFMSQSITNG